MKRAGRARLPFFLFALATVLLGRGAAEAGDAFLRGGLIFHPTDVDLAARWRASFGSDYAVNFRETVFVGFELQTSVYRQDTVSGRTVTFVPANGFVNVKVKSGSLGARPYGGGGMGLLSSFVIVSGASDWANDLGFHLLGGVEIGHLSLELQYQRAFESGSPSIWTAYAGFVF